MLLLGMLLIFGVVGGVSANPTSVMNEIKSHCAEEWPGDFAMQLWCVKRQIKAYNELNNHINVNWQTYTIWKYGNYFSRYSSTHISFLKKIQRTN